MTYAIEGLNILQYQITVKLTCVIKNPKNNYRVSTITIIAEEIFQCYDHFHDHHFSSLKCFGYKAAVKSYFCSILNQIYMIIGKL